MTDDEITELVLYASAQASGLCTALMAAVRALQAQPGYNHAAFTSTLAALQTQREHFTWPSPEAKAVFERALEQLGQPPPHVPSIGPDEPQ